jgi:transcription-repair coupling factor (superfamily II helicase)
VADRADLRALARGLAEAEPIVQAAEGSLDALVLSSGARALGLAALSSRRGGVVLAVTATEAEAISLSADVALLVDDPTEHRAEGASGRVAHFPAWDTLPLERVSPEVAAMGARAELRWRLESGRPPSVVVASVRALLQRLSPRVPAPLRVVRGEAVELDAFLRTLADLGYRREAQVEHRGEFAVRGGIVDVFGATAAAPVRLDLFGDVVDRLSTFDVADQRSSGSLDHAEFFTCREWIPDEQARQRARSMASVLPWAGSSLGRIAEGELFDGMEGFLGVLNPEGGLLTDRLGPGDLVALVEPRRLRDRALELHEEEQALVEALVATWSEGKVGHDVIGELHVDFDRLLQRSEAPVLALPAQADSPKSVGLPTRPIPSLVGDPAALAALVTELGSRGAPVLLCGATEQSARRFVEVLAAERIEATVVESVEQLAPGSVAAAWAPLVHGAIIVDPPLAVLAEADLTGRRTPHRTARPQQRVVDGFFDDLSVGSFVVHRHHGVARFAGVTSRTLAGATRDYLVLEFRGDDKLYLPVEQIDAITPYSGGEHPTLSKMGGSDWQRTRAKARAAASEVASELVELYRARLLAQGYAFSPDTPWQEEMEAAFGHVETPDQRRAIAEVKADMEQPRPMDRLVCADVGFGKTEVAVRAAFKAVQDNKQVAVLVPTTLLASQHHQTFSERFGGYPVEVRLLSRLVSDAEAAEVVAGLAAGTVDVVIGTHRLLSADIGFKDLGLLVVDEEQRFGVTHKEAVKRLAQGIDVLTLTASPIPRTLEMALTGIRDFSLITTPPVDRQPILTYVGEYEERAVAEAIRRELLREGQAFYVHNRVADIDDAARRIRSLVPEARVVVAHGQMDEGSLEKVVLDFADRQADILVCTTIVENGIDMPSVNTLIVERADLLGLGQLHQLRGRVGRRGQRAYAYLFHPADASLSEQAYERLRTIGEYTDLGSGFKIAMRDLEIRGAGNLLGRDQSGHVAAVGYDLYVQLVAEAVAEARGTPMPEVVSVSIDLPGEAHLPESYVAAEDARLEAYRRLAGATDESEVLDLAAEWRDRFGPLPAPAQGLVELGLLRTTCMRLGVRELSVLPARPGGRSTSVATLSPLDLAASAQVRAQRLLGDRAYDVEHRTLRFSLEPGRSSPAEVRALLDELVPAS